MYTCVKLSIKQIKEMEKLNESRKTFNNLNLDFFDIYNQSDFIGNFFLRRNLTLLLFNNIYIGYIWLEKKSKSNYTINALSIPGESGTLEAFAKLTGIFKKNCTYTFNCEKTDFNSYIIEKLNFKKTDSTFELYRNLEDFQYKIQLDDDITAETVTKGSKEKIRCTIQNDIFRNISRIPLTIKDIYYDEMQPSYYAKGSVLLKKGSTYIGYGQIIIENKVPTIVNFGIIKEFRGMGYGEMFLNYLFNIMKTNNFNMVFIKVKTDNISAFNLYTRNGFRFHKEFNTWELRT